MASTNDIRSTILNAVDIEEERLTVPEWGGVELLVRGLTGRDRAALQRQLMESGKKGAGVDMEKWYTEIVLASVHNPESGERVFGPGDRNAIASKSAKVLERIADVATRLSGMGARAVEQAEEDFEQAPNSDSPSS